MTRERIKRPELENCNLEKQGSLSRSFCALRNHVKRMGGYSEQAAHLSTQQERDAELADIRMRYCHDKGEAYDLTSTECVESYAPKHRISARRGKDRPGVDPCSGAEVNKRVLQDNPRLFRKAHGPGGAAAIARDRLNSKVAQEHRQCNERRRRL